MVEFTERAIDVGALVESCQTPECGGIAAFVGTTRQLTDGRETLELNYECYRSMALKTMRELESEARVRWPIRECRIVHRLGHVGLGESSVAIVVACPHRKESFEAAQWLIDELKVRAPIWKQEHWADGRREWVHPQVGQASRLSTEIPTTEYVPPSRGDVNGIDPVATFPGQLG